MEVHCVLNQVILNKDPHPLSSAELYKILSEAIEKEFEDILEEIQEDETGSEFTAKSYDVKKSYLMRHFTALLHLHRLLTKQHFLSIEQVTQKCPSRMSNQHLGLSSSQIYKILADVVEGEFQGILQKIEEDENSSAENYDEKKAYLRMCLSELSRLHRLLDKQHGRLIDEVKDGALNVKETKASVEKNSNKVVVDKKLRKFQEIEKSHLKLQKQVADLRLLVSKSDNRMQTLEEELETISCLKGDYSTETFQQNQKSERELQLSRNLLRTTHKELMTQLDCSLKLKTDMESSVVEIRMRDDKIKELNKKNDWYGSQLSKLEEELNSKECIWSNEVAKLNGQIKEQSESLNDLQERFNLVSSDKNKISGKLERVKEEKSSQDKLIDQLKTRLNMLEVECENLILSSKNAKKPNGSWKEKVKDRLKSFQLKKKSEKKSEKKL